MSISTSNPWFGSLQRLPLREITTPTSRVAWREAGGGPSITHVLLHGIGSSSANWLAQLEAASVNPAVRVLAWDAPGYGRSQALAAHAPTSADYAQRLLDWLDALAAQDAAAKLGGSAARAGTPPPITLVGHSLGCLIAASAAQQAPQRISQLILLSPAQGYAQAPAAERDKKLQDRLDLLARLGPAGVAQLRGAAMLAPHADVGQVALVQHIMAQIDPDGYSQAARMLAGGDLLADLSRFALIQGPAGQPRAGQPRAGLPQEGQTAPGSPVPAAVIVASGSADTITPPAGCAQVAAHIKVTHGATYISLGAVGHACAIEAAEQVTRLIGLAAPATHAQATNAPVITTQGASHAK